MKHLFKTLRAARGYFIQHLDDLSDEQFLEQPETAGHNILWNVGHIYDSHARLLYGQSGLPVPEPEQYRSMFDGGTSPADWAETPSTQEVMNLFRGQLNAIYEDFEAGKFAGFKRMELVPGYALDNLEDALTFMIFHESVHIGMVMSLRKQIGAVKV